MQLGPSQGRKLKISDPETGDDIRVKWLHPQDPTDADINDIVMAYRSKRGYAMTPAQTQVGDESAEFNRQQAQQISERSREVDAIRHPVREAALSPFSTIARKLPSVLQNKATDVMGGMADALSPVPNLARGFEAAAGVPSAPDAKTGASRAAVALARLGMGAYGAVNPLAVGAFNEAQHIVGRLSPTSGKIIHAVTNPAQSIFQPKTEFGQNIAEASDAVTQALAYEGAGKLGRKVQHNFSEGGQIAKGQKEFTQAVPPPTAKSRAKQAQSYPEKVATAAKYIADEARARKQATGRVFEKKGAPIVEQSLELGLEAEKRLYEKMTAPIKELKGVQVDLRNAVQRTFKEGIAENVRELHPEVDAAARKMLSPYNRDVPIEILNKEISDLNAEQRRFSRANPAEQSAMLRNDPNLPLKIQLARNMRETMFDVLEQNGVKNVPQLRKDYGHLSEVNDLQLEHRQSNLNKDKKSIFSGYGSPFRVGFWAGALGKIAGLGTGAAGALDAAVTGEQIISKSRSKPSALLQRSINRFAKSSLKGGDVEYGPRLLPEYGAGRRGSVQQIPNPNVNQSPRGVPRRPQTSLTNKVPESFIRGAGEAGLPPEGDLPLEAGPITPTPPKAPPGASGGGLKGTTSKNANIEPNERHLNEGTQPSGLDLMKNKLEVLKSGQKGRADESRNVAQKAEYAKEPGVKNPVKDASLDWKVSRAINKKGGVTNHANEIGESIGLREANVVLERVKGKESPYSLETTMAGGSQLYKEVLDKFIRDRFEKIDNLPLLRNYTVDQIVARLDWLNGGHDPKTFPSPLPF